MKNDLKILRVIASMNPSYGGPCQGIRNAVPQQKKLRVVNEVVCMDSSDASFIGKDDFPVIALGPAPNHWLYTKRLTPWLTDHIQRFDVVIVHGLWLYYGFAIYKVIKQLREKNQKVPKLFVMPHGMLDPYFQKASGRRLKAIRNWFYWKLIESKLINNADGVLFTCEEELNLAQKTFKPYHPRKAFNVGYGIIEPPPEVPAMTENFNEVCKGLENKRYLLFLSRIHDKKGVDLLINAYLTLNDQKRILPKLVIAGPGLDSDYGKQMQELAASCKNILFPGMLTGNAKWGALYGCDAFILPSHQENFGIAVVEALACRKPVLITNKINIYKEIQSADAGIISEDNEEGIILQLNEWIRLTVHEKNVLATKAKNVYKEFFSIEKSSSNFIEAVDSK